MHLALFADLPLSMIAALWIVLFMAGLVSGLSGFAFAAVAAILLWLLPAIQAIPLIMTLSTCNQLLSAGTLWREMRLVPTAGTECALPYIAGGLIGVPAGLAVLECLPAAQLCGVLGASLVAYSAFSLLRPDAMRLSLSGWRPAVLVGAAGGLVGGFSGFPGSMPVLYFNMRGLNRMQTRGVVQPYIVALQVASLATLIVTRPQIFDLRFTLLALAGLPAVLLGTASGVALYRRLSERNFRHGVLLLLIISGLALMAKAWVR
jgi:uncharacterized membrane protein YfcA